MDLEIERMLIVSTAHIPQSDGALLDKALGMSLVPTIEWRYGWIIFADALTEEQPKLKEFGYSDALFTLAKIAQDNDCGWLRLDSDGPQVEGLPEYEWDSIPL